MALGDFTPFRQFKLDLGNKIHDLDSDTWKVGLITSAVTPAASDAAPHWGGTGTTNFATNEVTPGGNYAANGPSLASVSYAASTNSASGATTNAAGYAIGATSITLAAAGTGAIASGETVQFAGDLSIYLVKTGVANVAAGGTLEIHGGLNKAIAASATNITQTPSVQWKAQKISIAQDAANPTNARWGIVYNSTDANKRAAGIIDFGSARDLSAGLFEHKFNSVDGVGTMITLP